MSVNDKLKKAHEDKIAAYREAERAYQEKWAEALNQRLIDRYGTTDPTYNQLTTATRRKYVGFDEKGQEVSVKVPYFTCMCPDKQVTYTSEQFNREFRIKTPRNVKVREDDTYLVSRRAMEIGDHQVGCPFRLLATEQPNWIKEIEKE